MKSIHELTALVSALRDALARDWRAALVTILKTSGSTFRRVGAAMLVYPDGSVVNALSGGCPQRDLVEWAKGAIRSGRIQYVAYNAEQGLDLLLEMGCSGTLEVIVEPVSPELTDFVDALEEAIGAREPFLITTRYPAEGAPERVARTVSKADSSVGPPTEVAQALCTCGADGSVILEESFLPAIRLVIAGACLEALDLARTGRLLGWSGAIVDAAPERLEQMPSLVDGWERCVAFPQALSVSTRIDASTAFVSMTHNLDQDIAYLLAARDGGAFYLGALGSRERAHTVSRIINSSALHMPAGLDVGSNTSLEIGLAVVAEVMAHRNRRDGRPLRLSSGPIH